VTQKSLPEPYGVRSVPLKDSARQVLGEAGIGVVRARVRQRAHWKEGAFSPSSFARTSLTVTTQVLSRDSVD
jgi:hypothetical protein